jgi:hypothetical protein
MKPGQFAIFAALGLLVCALVGGASGWAVSRHRVPEIVTHAQPAPHLMGASEPPSASWLANEEGAGHFWVTNPKYAGGAKCDGTTDDAAAFVATEAARAAFPDAIGNIPPTVCVVKSQINFADEAVWYGSPGHSTIRAGATMQAVVTESGYSTFVGIIFDGNRLANNAVLRLNDTRSRFTACEFNGGLVDGVRSAMGGGPATISAVTHTGGGPAITVSQIDPYYLQLSGGNECLKITLGGALGAATFQISGTGCGGSFSGTDQILSAKTQVGYPGGIGTFQTNSGLLLTATAGTYVLNDTYAFTATIANNQNNFSRFDHCAANHDGMTYASAGLIGQYGGPTYDSVSAPGTVTVSSGSQIVLGASTTWLTAMPGTIDGDGMWINGPGNTLGTGKRWMVSVILDNTHLALDLNHVPQYSASGLDWAIMVGAGFSEDPSTGNQTGSVLDLCLALNCALGMRFSGLGGPTILAPFITLTAGSAITLGTAFPD